MAENWTHAELSLFDRLVDGVSHPDRVVRIGARFDLDKFVALHGKAKCDAMFAYLESQPKKTKRA